MNSLPNLVTWQSMHTALNLQTVPAKFWPPTLLRDYGMLMVKNKLRSFQVKNLKEIFGHTIQEDHKQKIRVLDFTESSKSAAISNSDVNDIKGNNCFKCGSDAHFIKDYHLNKGNSNTHQRKHYTDQGNTNSNSTPNNSI